MMYVDLLYLRLVEQMLFGYQVLTSGKIYNIHPTNCAKSFSKYM